MYYFGFTKKNNLHGYGKSNSKEIAVGKGKNDEGKEMEGWWLYKSAAKGEAPNSFLVGKLCAPKGNIAKAQAAISKYDAENSLIAQKPYENTWDDILDEANEKMFTEPAWRQKMLYDPKLKALEDLFNSPPSLTGYDDANRPR